MRTDSVNFFKNIYLLAASSLSLSTQDLHCVMRDLSFRHVGFLVVAHTLQNTQLPRVVLVALRHMWTLVP